jgi:hypothetical protein
MRIHRLATATAVLLAVAAPVAPAHATVPPTVCDGTTTANPGPVIATGTNSGTFSLGTYVTCVGPSVSTRFLQVQGFWSGASFWGSWADGTCHESITGTASGVTFSGTMTGNCGTGSFNLNWPPPGGTIHGDMT